LTPKATPPTGEEPLPQPAILRVVVDHLSAMVAYWDSEQRCRFANRAYEKWFGVDPRTMVGRTMRDFLGPLYPLNLPYIEGALRGEPQEFERVIPNPSGGAPRHSLAQYVPDIVDGTVRGFCVLVTDITRLKQAEKSLLEVERRLQASERLAALATLAARIAHEINNPLTAVVTHLDIATECLSRPAPNLVSVANDLSVARESALRVGSIVQSMKLLARGDTTQRELVDVNDTRERRLEIVA
jgi:PAS domain S-box-containing protein